MELIGDIFSPREENYTKLLATLLSLERNLTKRIIQGINANPIKNGLKKIKGTENLKINKIRTEVPIQNGRLDLVINFESDSDHHEMILEVKVDSWAEHGNQIENYLKHIATRKKEKTIFTFGLISVPPLDSVKFKNPEFKGKLDFSIQWEEIYNTIQTYLEDSPKDKELTKVFQGIIKRRILVDFSNFEFPHNQEPSIGFVLTPLTLDFFEKFGEALFNLYVEKLNNPNIQIGRKNYGGIKFNEDDDNYGYSWSMYWKAEKNQKKDYISVELNWDYYDCLDQCEKPEKDNCDIIDSPDGGCYLGYVWVGKRKYSNHKEVINFHKSRISDFLKKTVGKNAEERIKFLKNIISKFS